MENMRQRMRHLFRRNKRRFRPTTAPTTEQKEEHAADEKPEANDASAKEVVEIEIIPLPLAEDEMPTYFHVGALAKECLSNGFKIGAWQLQCTTRTNTDFNISTFGEGYPTMESIFGGLEVFKDFGNYSMSLSWLTNNDFLSEIEGRGISFGSKLYAQLKSVIGTKDEVTFKTKIKCGFERKPVKMELVVPLYKEPLFLGYVVVTPMENWILGYRTIYDFDAKGFDKHAFCLGYYNDRTEVGLKLENFEDLRGSIFQRIGDAWGFALKSNLYSSANVKQFAVGVQYDFNNGTLVKVKFREDTRTGFVFQSKIGENVDVMYHLAFDANSPVKGNKRIGVSWYFHS
ncbi:voltage-dependent anion-selective channel [Drosophila eugracilis]|uniref:voltage-dependent anion-selective channel n=1 Tax=Drosophila eugracilis TaxID=29029 RepID=UPI0007E7CFFC|nr:voltage-dependent anion-selective channel [Drosophila eugracilis]